MHSKTATTCLLASLAAACSTEPDELTATTADVTATPAGFDWPGHDVFDDGRRYALNTPIFAQSLLDGIEPAQQFKLKTGPAGVKGRTIMLPFAYSGAGILAYGHADTSRLRTVLARQGLEPYPIEKATFYPLMAPTPEAKEALRTRSIIEIYGYRYDHTSAGPITLATVEVPVVNPADPEGPAALFIIDYFVNSPVAQTFAIEAWGILARLADTQSQFDGPDRGFRVSYNGRSTLEMKLVNAETRLGPETPLTHLTGVTISPRSGFGPGQAFNGVETSARFRVGLFDPAQDSFVTGGVLRHNLAALDYQGPVVWLAAKNFEGIHHTDLAQIPSHANDPVTDGSDPSRREW